MCSLELQCLEPFLWSLVARARGTLASLSVILFSCSAGLSVWIDTCWLRLNLCLVAVLDPSMLCLCIRQELALTVRWAVELDRYMLVAAQLVFGCSVGPQYVP